MTQQLPLFPLQIVVFPGESLNLHIFEPRYRQLVAEAEAEGITFGVPTVIGKEIKPIATEVALTEVSRRYPGGENDIRTIGRRIFRIHNFLPRLGTKLYAGGDVEFLDYDAEESLVLNEEIVELLKSIYEILNIDKKVKSVHEGFSTYDVAHYVGMSLEQEYEFLTCREAKPRQQFLLNHLRHIRPDITERLDIRARAKMNGHFKHLIPPDY